MNNESEDEHFTIFKFFPFYYFIIYHECPDFVSEIGDFTFFKPERSVKKKHTVLFKVWRENRWCFLRISIFF